MKVPVCFSIACYLVLALFAAGCRHGGSHAMTPDFPADYGLTTKTVTREGPGEAIERHDFERCQPAHIVKLLDPPDGGEARWLADGPEADRAGGYWMLRHPDWTPGLLNAEGNPAELTYDPQLSGEYDVYLGMRAVDPCSTVGVKMDDEDTFTWVSSPGATEQHHFNHEHLWRRRQNMDGRKIVFRAGELPFYLQHLKFVPWVEKSETLRTATDRVTVCRDPDTHYAFPGVAVMPNGDLAVVCRAGKAHVCPFGRIELIRSTDGGRTWQDPVTIADSPSDERDPSIHTLPDGRVVVTYQTWNSWMAYPRLRNRYREHTDRILRDGKRTYTGKFMMFSDDSGHTWSEPIRVPAFSPHGPEVGPEGYFYYPTLNTEGKVRAVDIKRGSPDAAEWEHWARVGTSAYARNVYGSVSVFEEPNSIRLDDGTWLTAIRVPNDGYVRLSRALDKEARQWIPPRKLSVRGYPQHLLQLSDGRLLMTYGYRFRPYGTRGCLSSDRGLTWDLDNEIVLRHDGATVDLGYPVSVELEDGRVFTVYYHNQEDSNCFIEGAFYRP